MACKFVALALLAAFDVRAGGLLLVANEGDQTLGIIDPAAGRQLATVPEDGATGHEVAASADGMRAFVPIYGDSTVGQPGSDGRLLRVIDLASRQVAGTVDFGRGVRPNGAVIGPKNGLLYVTTELDSTVTVVDPVALEVIGFIPTGQMDSHALAITSDGKRGYTANAGPGTVSVLNLETMKVAAIIRVSKGLQRIGISPDDRWVFTSDQTTPQLAVIGTANNQVSRWIPLPGVGAGTAATPDGRWLLVAVPKEKKVAVVDLKSMKVARALAVPASPQEALVNPNGLEAYVSCGESGQVAVIDLKKWVVSRVIPAGARAAGLAWARPR